MILDLVATGALAVVLALLAAHDLRHRRLPDRLTLPLVAAGLSLTYLRAPAEVPASVIGALVGGGLLWAIGAIHWHHRGTEGLGIGDAKLFAAAGAWLGWSWLPMVLLIASLGALIAAVLRPGTARGGIAFGPWLAVAFFLAWGLRVTGVPVPGTY